MGYRGRSLLVGCATVLVLLVGAAWLPLGIERASGWLPAGSDEVRFRVVNTTRVQLSYRLPRGFTWNTVYHRLTNQGWMIRDAEILVWPDLLDDNRTAAVFWRTEGPRVGRQWLRVRRDMSDHQRFVVEITQCVPVVFSASCA